MAGTTLGDTKRSLIGVLRGSPALAGWTITYTWPGETTGSTKAIWFGGATVTVTTTALRAGRRPRIEEPVLTVAIWSQVASAGASADECQEQADADTFAALAALDELIADEAKLGLPGTVDLEWLDGWDHDTGPHGEGAASLVTARVRYHARLL